MPGSGQHQQRQQRARQRPRSPGVHRRVARSGSTQQRRPGTRASAAPAPARSGAARASDARPRAPSRGRGPRQRAAPDRLMAPPRVKSTYSSTSGHSDHGHHDHHARCVAPARARGPCPHPRTGGGCRWPGDRQKATSHSASSSATARLPANCRKRGIGGLTASQRRRARPPAVPGPRSAPRP